jgi:hypothetical protein
MSLEEIEVSGSSRRGSLSLLLTLKLLWSSTPYHQLSYERTFSN